MRRYHIQDREDYHKCAPRSPSGARPAHRERPRQIQQAVRAPARIRAPARTAARGRPVPRADGGRGAQGAPRDVEHKLTVAAFCRRRLAVVMCAARMAETVSAVRAFSCLRGWTGRGLRACARRPSNLSSRGTSASARTRSQTPPSWSPGLLLSLVSYARFTDTPVRADIWRTL
jgi:hypothetical protein